LPPVGEAAANWTNVYSRVSGSLPLESIPLADSSKQLRVVRFQIEVVTPGKIDLVVAGGVEKMWCDAAPLAASSQVTLDLAEGTHTVTLLLATSTGDLRLELADVPGSPAQVQIVGGK
jgi:hypothetical protein